MAKKVVKRKVAKPVAKKPEPHKARLPLGLKIVMAILIFGAVLSIVLSVTQGVYNLFVFGIIAMQLIGIYFLYKTQKIGLILILALQIYGLYNEVSTILVLNQVPAELLWIAYLNIVFLPIDFGILIYLLYNRKLFK